MLFQCVIITSIVAAVTSTCPAMVANMDKNCALHDLGVATAAFPEDCQAVCNANPACLSFAYKYITQQCWPKNYVCTGSEITSADQVSYYVCVSGTCPTITTNTDKDCALHDLGGTIADSPFRCQAICGLFPACLSFVYKSDKKECWPKDYKCQGSEITSTNAADHVAYYVCGSGTCPTITTNADKNCALHDLGGTTADSPSHCQAVCGANPACLSFVYKSDTKQCWPKNYKCQGSEITSTNAADRVTYYVCGSGACPTMITNKDKNCAYHDLGPTTANSPSDCQAICSANPVCLSFVYKSDTKQCWPKNHVCAESELISTNAADLVAYYVCGGACPTMITNKDKNCAYHDLGPTTANSPSDCQAICSANPACLSFVYKSDTKQCWPKNHVCTGSELISTNAADLVAYYVCGFGPCQAVVENVDKNCALHDLGETTAAFPSECQAICGANPACLSFVYNAGTKQCWPKNYKCVGSEIVSYSPAGQMVYYVC